MITGFIVAPRQGMFKLSPIRIVIYNHRNADGKEENVNGTTSPQAGAQ